MKHVIEISFCLLVVALVALIVTVSLQLENYREAIETCQRAVLTQKQEYTVPCLKN